jgi:hypothetical protein
MSVILRLVIHLPLPVEKKSRRKPAAKPWIESTIAQLHRRPYMSLINLVIVLIVVGVLLWLVNNYIPMDRKIKNILNAVVVIVVVLWLLKVFGVLDTLGSIHVGNIGR